MKNDACAAFDSFIIVDMTYVHILLLDVYFWGIEVTHE